MSIVIDLLLGAALVFFMVWFTRMGFGRIIDKTGKAWTSLFSTMAAGPIVSDRIHAWFLSSGFTGAINNTLLGIVNNNPNGYSLSEMFAKLPQGFVSFLGHYNINIDQLIGTYGADVAATEEIIWDIAGKIADPCASIVSTIIGHLVFYFSFYFFAKWMYKVACNSESELKREIKAIRNEPDPEKQKAMLARLHKGKDTRRLRFVRFVNKSLGFIIGTAIGCCVVIAASVLLLTLFQVVVAYDANSPVTQIYENSHLFKFVNESGVWGMLKTAFSGGA